jgi:hypothetical protein
VHQLNGDYRLAADRAEALRADADRRRLARLAAAAGRRGRTPLRVTLGHLLIRAGRALGAREIRNAEAPSGLSSRRTGLEEAGT